MKHETRQMAASIENSISINFLPKLRCRFEFLFSSHFVHMTECLMERKNNNDKINKTKNCDQNMIETKGGKILLDQKC